MKKRTLILTCLIVVAVVALFFAVKLSTYDNSQSQCEHYQDSQRQQEDVEKSLNE